ncbi:P-loop containing nucleoside triphosphate hydrolase protein, partial [Chytridium lagenaria]
APTGSGKTCIMEMAIAKLLMQENGDQAKVVYMCPTKALCSERALDWQKKFRVLGISCEELTGDTQSSSMYEIQKSNIIVTTPEKWDSMTRKWRDNRQLMSLVRLILLDEVHMLNEPRRGSTLEVVVSRMKTVQIELRNTRNETTVAGQLSPGKIRYVAISATIPNIEDVATWLRDEDVRNSVYGAADHLLSDARYQESMSGHPFVRNSQHRIELQSLSRTVKDKKLQDYIANGIAVHHGGATSTLSVGVNLPAHLVIIKGIYQFINRQATEYSELDIMQMIGRAGRPQFDDSGTAVLMVPFDKKQKYENMLYGKEIVESFLHENLTENLNAEIVLGTIRSIELCIEWYSSFYKPKSKASP